jgi:hypothetical protein
VKLCETLILALSAVMYEVIIGKLCDFDLFKNQPAGPATAA